MSEEIWPVSIEQIEEVLGVWQNGALEEAEWRDLSDAEALDEAFLGHGLQIVPLIDDSTTFVIEVAGVKVGRPGSDFVGPHSANDALGIWLNLLHEHAGADPVPSMLWRTATAEEIAVAYERDAAAVDLILSPTQ